MSAPLGSTRVAFVSSHRVGSSCAPARSRRLRDPHRERQPNGLTQRPLMLTPSALARCGEALPAGATRPVAAAPARLHLGETCVDPPKLRDGVTMPLRSVRHVRPVTRRLVEDASALPVSDVLRVDAERGLSVLETPGEFGCGLVVLRESLASPPPSRLSRSAHLEQRRCGCRPGSSSPALDTTHARCRSFGRQSPAVVRVVVGVVLARGVPLSAG